LNLNQWFLIAGNQLPKQPARFLGSHASTSGHTPGHDSHATSHGHSSSAVQGDVVVPDLFDTLEWVLSSPPPVHQFDEPPVSYFSFFDKTLVIFVFFIRLWSKSNI
jgi:hypothetical protein